MYVFTGGMFCSKIENDFHEGSVWSKVMNELKPDIMVPSYSELRYGNEVFTNLMNALTQPTILTNGNYSLNKKLSVKFEKHRIVEIKGRKILLLGVLCDPKVKGDSYKYLKLVPIIEAIK